MTFEAIGTLWEIELADCEETKSIVEAVKVRIDEFDKNYSRFRADSLVTKMSTQAAIYQLPADAKPILDLYQELYEVTDGLMTPLIGQVLSDAGYDASYSLKPKAMSKAPKWADCIEYNYPQLLVKKPVLLDFGACGKGYLVDILAVLLKDYGCKEFIINAGGDMLHQGSKEIEVALEHPDNFNEAIGIANIKNQALCGSAGNRRAWAGYNHIMDSYTLKSPAHIKAVWVIAKTTMLADALATALYFTEPKQLLKRYNFNYALVKQDLSFGYSSGFAARFFK